MTQALRRPEVPEQRLPPAPVTEASGWPSSGRWARSYVRCLVALDIVAAVLASGAAFVIRFVTLQSSATAAHLVLTVAIVPVWVGAVAASRAYEQRFAGSGSEDIKRVGNAAVRVLALLAVLSFTFRLDLARGYVFGALVLASVLSLLARFAMRQVLLAKRRTGAWVDRVVVVGTALAATGLAEAIRTREDGGLAVTAACLVGPEVPTTVAGVPTYAGTHRILAALADTDADTVAVASCAEMDGVALRQLAWEIEGTGVDLLVSPALTDVTGSRIHIRPVSGLPLLHVEEPRLSGGRRLAKQVFDRVCAGLALLVLGLPLLLLGALVRLTSPGPAFYRQQRVGRAGTTFTIFKLRSMVDGAERQNLELGDDNIHGTGPLFKLVSDPRVTPLGGFLRRTSLDELPQLINVLRGDMSLVGPRPPLPAEVAAYEADVHRRLLVRPGLTGLWQVSGRSDLAWDESVRLDLHYVENWSLALDAVILMRTVKAVLARRGAY